MKATKLVTAFGLTAIAAAVSTSTYAVDLIKTDDLTLNLNGDIDLLIEHDSDNDNRTEAEANFDDVDFDFKWKIDDNLTFIAASDWTMESENNNTLQNDQIWAGVEIGDVTVRAGFQEDAIDPLGIDSFEIVDLGRASGDQDGGGTKFNESFFAAYEGDDYEIRGTYVVASEANTTSDDDEEQPKRTAFAGDVKVGDFLIEGGFGSETDFDEEITVDFWQAQVEYSIGQVKLGALYGEMDVDFTDASTTDLRSTGYELNVTYKVNSKLSVYAGYEAIDNHDSSYDNYTQQGVGAVYQFSKLAKLYVEAGTQNGTYWRGDSTRTATSSFNQTKDDVSVAGMLLSLDF
ncbi:porin [Marinomonas sp. C2222]|uniref:Porin n=1 Tax=Marinomonas sargassi TaxID=2984494 RepID=A0ABT2YS04_9GAMM|nr:porin [Marinomonas sargassi]MCV2402675.1 porin [Marinomonas sargassi]